MRCGVTSEPVLAAVSTTWRRCFDGIEPVELAPIFENLFWLGTSDKTALVQNVLVDTELLKDWNFIVNSDWTG